MAPDKIYLCADAPRVYDWSSVPFEKGGNIEYIRKDVLLEWAKEKEQNAITNIVKLTYRTVIDKLNSM